jgi:hypothetical protein
VTNHTQDGTLDSSGSESSASTLNQEVMLDLWNLYDTFMNTSLVRRLMLSMPLDPNLEVFDVTNRGRLERLWCALLVVLVECWHSERMLPTIRYIMSVTDTSKLVALLRRSRSDGTTNLLIECRHYMFHRDRRGYWDKGRLCPLGRLEANDQLHMAFSDVLLVAARHANEAAQRLGIRFPGSKDSDLPWSADDSTAPAGQPVD